ncbi:hypothetical protein ABZT49_28990 [Methylobacterium sp. EM32]|uniref:hypothetical protein n=1 Tax=Methylobacterium sp. EM32 TaxID=3163481 RepID=UPI0033B7C52C
MTDLRLLCFAKGRPGRWEAICVDLDIAVQGETQQEVLTLMQTSIANYLEAVNAEEPAVRALLLRRRAPWHVRAGLVIGFLWHALTRRDRGDYRASYELPCPV